MLAATKWMGERPASLTPDVRDDAKLSTVMA